jgi:hypothetical protein
MVCLVLILYIFGAAYGLGHLLLDVLLIGGYGGFSALCGAGDLARMWTLWRVGGLEI